MQLYWQKLRHLDLWLLVALTDVGVSVPWLFVLYRATFRPQWYMAAPGLWLGLTVYAAAALWESGTNAEAPAAPRRRVMAMLIGLAGAYAIAYWVMPAALQTGLLSWNPAVGFLPVVGYLWFMGARSVTEGLSLFVLRPRGPYQWSAAALGTLILVRIGGMGYSQVRPQATWGLILVLVAHLLTLYVARTRAIQADQAAFGDTPAGQGERSPRLGAVIAGLLALTLTVSFFGSDAAVQAVGGALSTAAGWVRALLWLLVSKYAALLTPLLDWLLALFLWLYRRRPIPRGVTDPENQPPGVPEWLEQLQRARTIDIQVPLMLGGILLGLALLGLLVYLLHRSRMRREQDPDEEFVSLGFWPNLLADLQRLFRSLPAGSGGAPDGHARLDRRDPRMLFRRLQAWGARQRRPRCLSETPNAYGDALGQARPDSARAAGIVVAVYNQARYGAAPPDGARVAEAVAAVAELEREHDREMPG